MMTDLIGLTPDAITSGLAVRVEFHEAAGGLYLPYFRPTGGPLRSAAGKAESSSATAASHQASTSRSWTVHRGSDRSRPELGARQALYARLRLQRELRQGLKVL
jgi:hypothetical protein